MIKQGRSKVKRYCCVFTCLTTRAVHIELALDLTMDGFLNALRRFISRQRSVKHLYPDNSTNFVGAEKILRNEFLKFDQDRVHEHMSNKGIEWSFNVPAASHHGGVWERMVRSIRRVLSILNPGLIYNEDVLHTVLTEIEAIINSRPLFPITFLDVEERPLTPNDLLLPDANVSLLSPQPDKSDQYLLNKYKRTKFLISKERERWINEYLHNIADRTNWLREKRNLCVNDVVMLSTDSLANNMELGRVIEVYPDKRGYVRKARLRLKNHELLRPITKMRLLIPAEESATETIPPWFKTVAEKDKYQSLKS